MKKTTAMLFTFVLVCLLSAPALAVQNDNDPTRVVFVLDASGSMWGQIDGKAKITIAKEVMVNLIDSIPADFETGLIVYGHRRKGDCGDIEMVIPLGPHNPSAMKSKVQAIQPKGKTPLSAAVLQAAQALRYTEQRATVILVSDGLETCDMDPCALATKLAKTGVDFSAHVIGFGLSKGDQDRLRCLADGTGGLFLAADNADSLRDALNQTVEQAKEPPAPVVEDPGSAEINGPAQAPVASSFKVSWKGPDSRGDTITIAPKGSRDNEYTGYAYTKRGDPATLIAPSQEGAYELRYYHEHTNRVLARADIQITPVEATLQAPQSANAASEFEVSWTGPGYRADYISVAKPGQRSVDYETYTYASRGNPLKLRAPSDPGKYEVRYVLGKGDKILAKENIEIKAVTASVSPPASADAASDFDVSWTGPDNRPDFISIARPDQRPSEYVHYAKTYRGNPLKLRAPSDPGTYEVRYIQGQGSKLLAKANIEIKAVTASVSPPASADAASDFDVSWTGPDNRPDFISIARPDQRPSEYVHYAKTYRGNPLKLRAPSDPGTYEVRYIQGQGSKLLAKANIEIKAVTASVSPPASADAASDFNVSWTGPNNRPDFISIARPDQGPGEYVHYAKTYRGNPLKLRAPSEPGTYEVRYILGQGSKILAKANIEIKAVTASVSPPASADAASDFNVSWTGPDAQGDYISLAKPDQGPSEYKAYTYTRRGNPLKLRAPSEPGTYEVRYILGQGDKILAKTNIEIKAVTASLKAPQSADAASDFDVSWTGPNAQGDYISLARPDQGPGEYKAYTYTSRGNPLKLRAPSEPGTYEVRYILGQGDKILAKTNIEIKAVTASVSPPASATADSEFEVNWTGPGYKDDYISLAKPDQGPDEYKAYTYTSRGNPLKLRAPADPGTYEVRYILGQGSKLLDSKRIAITAGTGSK